MKRFTGHQEPWGTFVDAKVNAPELLAREILRKKKGRVWVSGVCDAYQPLERTYQLTRRCLGILVEHGWPVTVQTKSPLVLRDLDLLRQATDVEVGFTITTAHERIRRIFEPGAPPIARRIEALAALHAAGVPTFVMVAPLLPGAEELAGLLRGKVDRALIDRCNYHHADRTYREHGLGWAMPRSSSRRRARRCDPRSSGPASPVRSCTEEREPTGSRRSAASGGAAVRRAQRLGLQAIGVEVAALVLLAAPAPAGLVAAGRAAGDQAGRGTEGGGDLREYAHAVV